MPRLLAAAAVLALVASPAVAKKGGHHKHAAQAQGHAHRGGKHKG